MVVVVAAVVVEVVVDSSIAVRHHVQRHNMAIEADITIEVAVDITVVMDKVVTIATGVKVMIIAGSKMETTLGATGNAVTGIRTVVADDLTMEIGEVVAKIIAVDGNRNPGTVKMVINQGKIGIIEKFLGDDGLNGHARTYLLLGILFPRIEV